MLKRIIVLSLLIALAGLTVLNGTKLPLFFYVFYPGLILPVIYLFLEDIERKKFLFTAVGLISALFFYFLIRYPSPETIVLGIAQITACLTFLFYQKIWGVRLADATSKTKVSFHDLDSLKQKHRTRLDSLHHLEKQVSGLLDLFEIARDFSEHLNYEGMAGILHKKVLPELPFQKMQLLVFDKDTAENLTARFEVTADGVNISDLKLSQELKEAILELRHECRMIKKSGFWLFPLMNDGKLAATLAVSGANEDDLAKFEVLSSYMTLQVKKVGLYETVKELAIRDGLTGVFVRRHFAERFQEELRRCEKYQLPLAVLMLDIDHFKRYNDEYGHLAGDATLKQVASILRESLRQVDIVARYGGEEFIMVLPETRKEGALEVAERIRSNVARHNFKIYSQETRVTVSIGVSLYPSKKLQQIEGDISQSVQTLILAADKALYRAKDEGRNRIILNQDA